MIPIANNAIINNNINMKNRTNLNVNSQINKKFYENFNTKKMRDNYINSDEYHHDIHTLKIQLNFAKSNIYEEIYKYILCVLTYPNIPSDLSNIPNITNKLTTLTNIFFQLNVLYNLQRK